MADRQQLSKPLRATRRPLKPVLPILNPSTACAFPRGEAHSASRDCWRPGHASESLGGRRMPADTDIVWPEAAAGADIERAAGNAFHRHRAKNAERCAR